MQVIDERVGRTPVGVVLERWGDRLLIGDDCWIWTGATNNKGYGWASIDGKKRLVHRVMYEILIGPIPEGLDLGHVCHDEEQHCLGGQCEHRRCVRPDHLRPMTRQANLLGGDTIPAWNAAATQCPRGHLYDEENTYVTPQGWRHCRECNRTECGMRARKRSALSRAAKLARREAEFEAIDRPIPVACKHGHRFDAWNTFIDKRGTLVCRRCRADAVTKWQTAKKGN